jgi:hypothetical protein
MHKIPDGNHLEYICENTQHRQRIICRRGKIIPRNPICYNGKRKNHSKCKFRIENIFSGCHVENENVTFSKSYYRHRENVYYTCNNNSVPLLANQTIRCINGNLSEQPICHTSK